MIFDTGSAWLWIASRLCEDFSNGQPKFDERNSHSFYFYNVLYDQHYGSGDVYGYMSRD